MKKSAVDYIEERLRDFASAQGLNLGWGVIEDLIKQAREIEQDRAEEIRLNAYQEVWSVIQDKIKQLSTEI